MHVFSETIEFPMVRKGVGFIVVVSREAIEGTAGHPMPFEDRERWVRDNMDLVTRTADRIRPLRTSRGERVFVESKHVIAQGLPAHA
ncbi:hypothetical protein [Sphingomonas glacialis]|nr:hypothetical protein [Sphingomonas glacialis]